jgi:hypothetical protein
VTSEDAGAVWESQAEVDAVLSETGATVNKVRRWRREGLLSKEIDWRPGSVVRYPKGTCAQIRAITALLKDKDRGKYVGLQLWRRGFLVDEKYWRPQLQRSARLLDRVIPLLMRLIQRFDRNEQDRSFYDEAAKRLEPVNNVVLSRIKGRVNSQEMPTVLRVIGDVWTGDFDGFETSIAGEEHTSDEALTIRALDLTKAGSDSILGRQLNLIELLPFGLKKVSAAISMGNLENVANAPAEGIARARDDAKNSVAIALHLYEANRWIYGDGAFGLRLAAWIARKVPDGLVDITTLLMFRLREVPGAILPSDKISEMAKQARKVCLYSKRHEWHWRNHPSFSKILHPNRIKLAFADEIALKQWQRELNAIILQATANPPTGAIDDGQEVGKSH